MTANRIGRRAARRKAKEVTEIALMNATDGIKPAFDETQLLDGLRRIGIEPGDTIFVQVSLGALGRPKGCATDEEAWAMLLRALQEAVGAAGTILVPTYTFSFCRQEDFDVAATPTAGGPWSSSAGFLEFFHRAPGAVRSRDPIHSVAGIGPRAAQLLRDLPPTCFGSGSIHERLLQAGGKICLIGVGLYEASFRHYVEEFVGIPGRFKKLFTGWIRDNGANRKQGWIYNVRILADEFYPDGSRLETLARESGAVRVTRVGEGEVLGIEARRYFDLTSEQLRRDPMFTVRGPAAEPMAAEDARVGAKIPHVALSAGASMEQIIDRLWPLPRDLVSDGYDAALSAIGRELPMTVHEFASGTECWTWLVPEKWTCHEAYLETLGGRRLFSYADHPLHVVSFSLPFEGVVPREELFRHLHVHARSPDAIPYIFKYYERDWGLCCSRRLKESLRDEKYRVVIRTSFRYGTLKVGEVIAPGETDETFVLSSHLCHPAMVNDDITGVAVGIDVMRQILRRPRRRYTYRYLIVPETIGGVAWLSRHESLIPRIKGGLFLEMLGLDNPAALQLSFDGNTELDRLFSLVLKAREPFGWTGAFRTVIGNDERQFNGPGVRVPMLSLSRVLTRTHPDWPYPEYHSSADNLSVCFPKKLAESRDLILAMVDALEHNRVPVNRFRGEPFCSRYGIFVDGYTNPEGNKSLFDVMFLIDGTRSVAEIAEACGVSFDSVRRTVEELAQHGLIDYREDRGHD
jgi:aminopeptidase-like protein/aminoglycoside N3'-acetyltransferase